MSTFDHSHIEHAVDSLRSEGRDQHLDREPESDIRTNHLVLVIQTAVTGSLVEEDVVSHIAAKAIKLSL